jgi:hypothetical protein
VRRVALRYSCATAQEGTPSLRRLDLAFGNRSFSLELCGALLALVATAAAQGQKAADWYPSRYGATDQRGAANLITPAKVLEAKNLIRMGQTYELGHAYEATMPLFGTRHFSLRIPQTFGPQGTNRMMYHDEVVSGELGQVGTQFDGLGHTGIGDLFRATNAIGPRRRCSISSSSGTTPSLRLCAKPWAVHCRSMCGKSSRHISSAVASSTASCACAARTATPRSSSRSAVSGGGFVRRAAPGGEASGWPQYARGVAIGG